MSQSIDLENVPIELAIRLMKRAADNQRSLESEIIAILEDAVRTEADADSNDFVSGQLGLDSA